MNIKFDQSKILARSSMIKTVQIIREYNRQSSNTSGFHNSKVTTYENKTDLTKIQMNFEQTLNFNDYSRKFTHIDDDIYSPINYKKGGTNKKRPDSSTFQMGMLYCSQEGQKQENSSFMSQSRKSLQGASRVNSSNQQKILKKQTTMFKKGSPTSNQQSSSIRSSMKDENSPISMEKNVYRVTDAMNRKKTVNIQFESDSESVEAENKNWQYSRQVSKASNMSLSKYRKQSILSH